MRSNNVASWMDEMLQRLVTQNGSVEDAKASTDATAGHSVESFVSELRKRVGLDGLEKVAVENPDFAHVAPGRSAGDPERQVKEIRERFKLLQIQLDDLLGKPGESPIKRQQHVRDAGERLKRLLNQSRDETSNSYLNELRRAAEEVSEKFGAVFTDGAELEPDEAAIVDILDEIKHGLTVLARNAKPDTMVDLDLVPKSQGKSAPVLAASAAPMVPLQKRSKSTVEDEPTDKKKILAEMIQYLKTYHLRPTHAMKEPEALFFELKDKFGVNIVQEIGRGKIMEIIDYLREEMKEPSMSDGLPKYDGSPMPLRDESEEKPAQHKTPQR